MQTSTKKYNHKIEHIFFGTWFFICYLICSFGIVLVLKALCETCWVYNSYAFARGNLPWQKELWWTVHIASWWPYVHLKWAMWQESNGGLWPQKMLSMACATSFFRRSAARFMHGNAIHGFRPYLILECPWFCLMHPCLRCFQDKRSCMLHSCFMHAAFMSHACCIHATCMHCVSAKVCRQTRCLTYFFMKPAQDLQTWRTLSRRLYSPLLGRTMKRSKQWPLGMP